MPSRSLLRDRITHQRLLITFYYFETVGLAFASYLTYPSRWVIFYGFMFVVFSTITFWALLDRQLHATRGDESSERSDHGWLCDDPFCERCRGYYAGLGSAVPVVITLNQRGVELIQTSGIDPLVVFIGGFILFFLTTPLQGVIRSSTRAILHSAGIEDRLMHPNFFKTLMGVLSGFAVGVMAIAVLAM